jgi:hypothetical protein
MLQLARDQDLTDAMRASVGLVGLIACQIGHGEQAARLLGTMTAQLESIGAGGDPLWQLLENTIVAPAREALGEEAWAAAFTAGRSLSPEEAIAEALEEVREGAL